MGTLKIEKIGGIGSYGSPRSHLKSDGELPMSALSAADQAAVEDLFSNPEAHKGSGQVADGHAYRITRTVNGKDQQVEIPEEAVPPALKACVKDRLT
jgi:hypothetical protein